MTPSKQLQKAIMYLTDSAKWKAYQFSDPFSLTSFCVCNKQTSVFCRPDCDGRPISLVKLEIKFVYTPQEALLLGFHPCELCDPVNTPGVDVSLLIKCVALINDMLGFCPPLLDDNEERNNQQIKRTILQGGRRDEKRRMLVVGDRELELALLLKNDLDHYRLVDLACRHLALAAAMNYFHIPSPRPSVLSPEDSPKDGRKRRRRGGVLGFKELAAKLKLSAWHFHRVFKLVTGLTPKTYGDKCWDFFKMYSPDDALPLMLQAHMPVATAAPVAVLPQQSPRKRVKLEPHPMVMPQPPMLFGQVDGAMLYGHELTLQPEYEMLNKQFNVDLLDNLMLFPTTTHTRLQLMPEAPVVLPMMAMPPTMAELSPVAMPVMDDYAIDMFSLDPVRMEVLELDDFGANLGLGYQELATFTS